MVLVAEGLARGLVRGLKVMAGEQIASAAEKLSRPPVPADVEWTAYGVLHVHHDSRKQT